MFELVDNVSIPKMVRPESAIKRKYPFDKMEVGQMFFVPDKVKNTLSTHASMVGRQLDKKFATRLCHMHKTKAGWVPCDPSAKGATLGIGVWRQA